MRIAIDYDRCEGHGLREEQAPEVFELEDDGNLIHHYDDQDITAELAQKASRAAVVCPVAALKVVE